MRSSEKKKSATEFVSKQDHSANGDKTSRKKRTQVTVNNGKNVTTKVQNKNISSSKRNNEGHKPPSKNSGPSKMKQRRDGIPLTKKKNKKTKAKKHHKNSKPKKPRSLKPHDAPMGKKDIYFALDCEMVGVGPDGTESALAKVTIVNWDNEVVLDTHVKVTVPVTNYRTYVSGITQKDIESDDAMDIDECRALVQSTLKGKILIGHGLENDLQVLCLQHPWCDIRDTAYYAPYMAVRESSKDNVGGGDGTSMFPRKLRDLAWEKLDKVIQVEGKPHSAMEDAIAAMDLYKAARDEWEMMLSKKVMELNEIETSLERRERRFMSERGQKQQVQPTFRERYGGNINVIQQQQRQQQQRQQQQCRAAGPPNFGEIGPERSANVIQQHQHHQTSLNFHKRHHQPQNEGFNINFLPPPLRDDFMLHSSVPLRHPMDVRSMGLPLTKVIQPPYPPPLQGIKVYDTMFSHTHIPMQA